MSNPFNFGAGGRGQADAAQAQGGCGGGVIKITISMGSEINFLGSSEAFGKVAQS